ncbi:hypothetical protein SAMN04488037_1193 [Shimia marina]|uniref:Putative ATPase n=2 Tax=Shimia marina TaxID=321267 RepID=A0A0P1FG67_9RHOB|nr:putative ATPase [Shimia marina]SFE74949.1 hypothetical protein SAMN04488037_1193 [Shimia marina]
MLKARWEKANSLSFPSPQLVIIKGERGVGKTRLALEFFRWLSTQENVVNGERYWLDDIRQIERHNEVNPDPDDCQFQHPIPFLWWGIKGQTGIAANSLASADRFLAPHLASLSVKAQMLSSGKSISKIWRDVIKGELASWSGYDTALAVGEGVFKTIDILRGSVGTKSDRFTKASAKAPLSRVDALMQDLESVFNPQALTFARTPAIVLIDDAQFSSDDRSLSVFMERMLHRSFTQSWPVLIIVTHWKRDLSANYFSPERSFAGILNHGRNLKPSDNGPAAGLPGGFLNDANTLEIDLTPVKDLRGALAEACPGLYAAQANALLDRAGGNPRHLEQIIALLEENEDFFEDLDPAKCLTEEGLHEALSVTQDIFRVVMKRLRAAPIEVQEAICLASSNGMRFSTQTVEALSLHHLGKGCSGPLEQAQDPYSMVSGHRNSNVAEFSERLFFMVAEQRRKTLKKLTDETALIASLKTVLRDRLKASKFGGLDEEAVTLHLAASLLSTNDSEDRSYLAEVLLQLAWVEHQRYAHEDSHDAALRFHEIIATQPDLFDKIELVSYLVATDILTEFGSIIPALQLLEIMSERLFDLRKRLGDASVSAEQIVLEALAFYRAGVAAHHAGYYEASYDLLEKANRLFLLVAEQSKTTTHLEFLANSFSSLADFASTCRDRDYEEAQRNNVMVVRKAIVEQDPSTENLVKLLKSQSNLCALRFGHSRITGLEMEKALHIIEGLAENSPIPDVLALYSETLRHMWKVEDLCDSFELALDYSHRSVKVARELVQQSQRPYHLHVLAKALSAYTYSLMAHDEFQAALEAAEEVLRIRRDLVDRVRTLDDQHNLAVALELVATVQNSDGDEAGAILNQREAVKAARAASDSDSAHTPKITLSSCLSSLGFMLQWGENPSEAKEVYKEAVDILRQLPEYIADSEVVEDWCRLLLRNLEVTGWDGDNEEAVALIDEGEKLLCKLDDTVRQAFKEEFARQRAYLDD